MSEFKVGLEIIGEVSPAPNADSLDLVKLERIDYDFITMKGLYEPGDVVVYFPVDSLLPDWIIKALDLEGRLAHGAHTEDDTPRRRDRVKTIRLRGNYSL